MVLRRFARVLVAMMFVAWSAALTAAWWQVAFRTDQTLIVLGFIVGALLVWWGVLSAAAGSVGGAGFALLAAIAWWTLRYLGRTGSGATGPLVFAEDLWGVGLIGCLVIAKLLPWNPRRRSAAADARIYATTEWGTPGQAGTSAASFGAGSAEINLGPDTQVVQRLKDLITQDSARYVHGLRFGTSVDVDHAVVVGDRVALINVRTWRPGMYSWASPLRVQYYGERFPGGSAEISTAVIQCRIQTGLDVGVRAWLVLVPPGEGEKHTYVLDNTAAPDGVRLCLIEDLEVIGQWLAGAADAVDPSVVRALVAAHKLRPSSAEPALLRQRERIRVPAVPGRIQPRSPGRRRVRHRTGMT